MEHSQFDHLFRREYGHLLALLTSRYGTAYIELIEDAIQEALFKAMKIWPYKGVPDQPAAWLYRVAQRDIIDVLRKDARLSNETPVEEVLDRELNVVLDVELGDEQLKMFFACCHPVLQETERVMLCLKWLGGFSIAEIASAFLQKGATVKKRIYRARQKLQEELDQIYVPSGYELPKRLNDVFRVIYLLFNEGYKASLGAQLIRRDICDEAIRLAEQLQLNQYCNTPVLKALLALMYFHSSRFDVRLSEEGMLLTLDKQDWTKWSHTDIQQGKRYLVAASEGDYLSTYHIQAAIAACYSLAENYSAISWTELLYYYDILLEIEPTFVVALHRLVVVEKIEGAEKALAILQTWEDQCKVKDYYMYYSIKSDLLYKSGKVKEAIQLMEQLLPQVKNAAERHFLQNKCAQWKTTFS